MTPFKELKKNLSQCMRVLNAFSRVDSEGLINMELLKVSLHLLVGYKPGTFNVYGGHSNKPK